MLTEEQRDERQANRWRHTDDVLRDLSDGCPAAADHAYVVGAWVWVEFSADPGEDIRTYLKVAGFSWNKDRGAWQHPCGVFRKASPGSDPRDRYGAVPVRQYLSEGVN